MKRLFTFSLLVIATSPEVFSQLQLTAGDRCTCAFGPTNFFLFGGGPGPFQPVFGEVIVRLYETALPPGTVLHYEMFENNATEQPTCAGFMTDTNSNPTVAGCDANNAWGDLQGTVRLTMVSGSVTLHSVALQVGRFSNGQYQRWQGGLPMQSIVVDPHLSVARVSNDRVQLAWPTNDTSYVLEEALTLPASSWSAVTNGVTNVGGQFTVVLPISQKQAVFRLRKP